MFFLSLAGTLILILVLISFRERPNISFDEPSLLSKSEEKTHILSFREQLSLLNDSSFWLATISSSLTISLYFTFSTLVD